MSDLLWPGLLACTDTHTHTHILPVKVLKALHLLNSCRRWTLHLCIHLYCTSAGEMDRFTHTLTWRHREQGCPKSNPVRVRCSQGGTASGQVHSQHSKAQEQRERWTVRQTDLLRDRQTDRWTSNQENINRTTNFSINSSSCSWKRDVACQVSVGPLPLPRDCENFCHLSSHPLPLDELKDKSCNYPVI